MRLIGGGMLLVACTSPSTEELLEGKACTIDRRCVEGYACNDQNACVRVGSSSTGGAGGAGATLTGQGGEGGPNASPTGGGGVGASQATGGDSGLGATASAGAAGEGAQVTHGEAGSGANPVGGGAGAGASQATGGNAGSGASPAGGAPTGGAGGTGGANPCPGPPEDCTAVLTALRHRYSFDDGAVDSVGAADGTLERGAALTGDGAVELSGTTFTSGAYVDLPNGIVSVLGDATFEVWVEWDGVGASWQRIFDFGEAMSVMGTSCVAGGPSAPEDSTGVCGRTYLALYANTDGIPNGPPRVAFLAQPGTPTADAVKLDSSTNLQANTIRHLAVVVNDAANRLALYRDGTPDVSIPFAHALAEIRDINNWLGRSQFTGDPTFDGEILEFRIYGAALTDSQIATSFAAGPDPAFLQ